MGIPAGGTDFELLFNFARELLLRISWLQASNSLFKANFVVPFVAKPLVRVHSELV